MMTESFNSSVIQVGTPDGTMYVTVIEDSTGNPVSIQIQIGKTGTSIRAWTSAITGLINRLLSYNTPLADIISDLASHSTSKSSFNRSGSVKSGPDGVVYALFVYQKNKYVERTNLPYFGG